MKATKSFKVQIAATTQISHTKDGLVIKSTHDLVKNLTNSQLVELFINMSSDAGVPCSDRLSRFATKQIGATKIIALFNKHFVVTALKKSTTTNPVRRAWDIFRTHVNSSRSDIIKLCRDAGISKGTASTQWWLFRKQNGIA